MKILLLSFLQAASYLALLLAILSLALHHLHGENAPGNLLETLDTHYLVVLTLFLKLSYRALH